MEYRREIDGLRALAVLPVVLFHAGLEGFSGGYLGVDVFFVISGYLITGILIQDYQAQRFSLAHFYDRRARRLLPALTLVMLCTLPPAWLWLMPGQFESYSASLIAVTFFVSNILFWQGTGYFADSVEEKPLLHTWSLAVEEQFYIVFPILLLLMWRFDQRHIRFWLMVILVASLLLAEHLSKTAESAGFYLLPARAWELMAGALVAHQEFRKGVATGSRNSIYALVGLLLILLSVVAFSEGTRHPSVYTVVPVWGTVLVIRYGRDPGWAHKLLTLKPVVGIGLISYSLYLWHQPLFAFARIRTLHEPGLPLMLGLAGLAVLLAWGSWAYVEAPFRKRSEGYFTRGRIFAYSALVGACFAFVGFMGVWANGFTSRFPADIHYIFWDAKAVNPKSSYCFSKPPEFYFSEEHFEQCSLGNTEKVRTFIWGDSHSAALAWELGHALGREGEGLLQASSGGCLPIIDYDTKRCADFNRHIYQELRRSDIEVLVLHGYWASHVEEFLDSDKSRDIDIHQSQVTGRDVLRRIPIALQGYLEAGFKIVLVYSVPEAGFDVPQYSFKSLVFGVDEDESFDFDEEGTLYVSTDYDDHLARNESIIAAKDSVQHPDLKRVRPDKYLCDSFVEGRCLKSYKGRMFYFDEDHLNNIGARLVVPSIVKQVQALLED